MNEKLKVGVLYGGISSEREVSINTGKQISENLNRDKYEVIEIVLNEKRDIFKCDGLDFVFIALHGSFGEDGRVQSILESMDIKYNGCDFFTSSICMNKFIVKNILSNFGINMAKVIILNKNNFDLSNFDLKFPVIVKPNSGGSSLGVYLSKNYNELLEHVKIAFDYDDNILVEEFIEGQEISCGILNGEVLPIFKITTQNREFFNYESKYDDTTIEEPAHFSEELNAKIKEIALKCYNIFSCKVYSRIEFIIKDNLPYFLEINTLPGMTTGSLFPKMAKSIGIEFQDLLDVIISSSFNNF